MSVLSLRNRCDAAEAAGRGASRSPLLASALTAELCTALGTPAPDAHTALVWGALTTGDAHAPERYVLADERFVMIEGKHVNRGWADYRDHHLKEELDGLAKIRFRLSNYRVQMDGRLAAVSFLFNILPKSGPERDFGSGRATAVLVRTAEGWKLQELHTS